MKQVQSTVTSTTSILGGFSAGDEGTGGAGMVEDRAWQAAWKKTQSMREHCSSAPCSLPLLLLKNLINLLHAETYRRAELNVQSLFRNSWEAGRMLRPHCRVCKKRNLSS